MTLPLFDVERPAHDREASQWFTPPWLAKRLIACAAMICRLGFVANQGTRRAVVEAGWSWVGVAILGRVRFEGDGDTSPLSDFAATLDWWDR